MYNKKLLIQKDISIIEALRRLDETADKVVFVVGDNNKLLGTLTDGDVRRYLLNGGSLEHTITEVYNRTPKSIFEKEYSHDKAKTIFLNYKISLLPIVDGENTIVDVVPWNRLFSEESNRPRRTVKKIKAPVVIMAGGKGTRLDPFTRILPKPLIPIGDKPVIQLIMDRFHGCGVEDFYLTLNHGSRMIKAYFEEFKTKYKITYIDEKEPLGTAGGLKYLPSEITGSFFVSNSDIIVEEDYGKILKFHKDNKNEITIVVSIMNYNIPYGICDIENGGNLRTIREKPNFSFLVNTGMYVLNSSVLRIIPENELYHITQLIEDTKSQGRKVGVFPVSEKSWIDVGEWGKYKEALEHFKI